MIRIIFLQKTDRYSGAENIVLTIIKLLPKHKYECVYVSPDGEIRNFVEKENVQFFALENTGLKSIKQAMLKLKPDIIHATDYGMSSYASILKLNIPIVSHLHSNVKWLRNPFYPKTIFFAKALSGIDQVISVSSSIQKEFIYGKLLNNKNHVIPNVVDIDHIKKLAVQSCDQAELKYDIAFLGRLSRPKNPLMFCRIIKEYKKINQDIKTVMIGDGELRYEVEEYIAKNSLDANILLVGFQKNPYCYVKNARILLMPSECEGFGLAAVEGMAFGKPVVCSGVGGLSDVVLSNCGAVCKRESEYINEIIKLLGDDEYYSQKAKNAIKRAEIFGNMSDYINSIMNVYERCLNGKG